MKGVFMISCTITDLKDFMAKLLTSDCFDCFLLEQALITTFNTFTIDGHLEKDFYTEDEWNDPALCPYKLSPWSDLRSVCFSLIKGKKPPVTMKYVFQLKPEHMKKLLEGNDCSLSDDILKAFILVIRYGVNQTTCTTGISLSSFVPDKTPEKIWDKAFQIFLEKHNISYQI